MLGNAMRCGPFLEVFPTGEPGGFRLIGQLGLQAAEPLQALLEPVASCGIGLTLDCAGVSSIDPIGLGVVVRMLDCRGGTAVLVTNATRRVIAVLDRLLPDGHPGLLIVPEVRGHRGVEPAAS
jgi:hypothetical protein